MDKGNQDLNEYNDNEGNNDNNNQPGPPKNVKIINKLLLKKITFCCSKNNNFVFVFVCQWGFLDFYIVFSILVDKKGGGGMVATIH